LVGTRAGKVGIWDVASHARLFTTRGNAELISAAFDPTGSQILTANLDNSANVFDARSGSAIVRLVGSELALTRAVYSRDGTMIATASRDGTARVWESRSGSQRVVIRGQDGALLDVAFSPNGTLLATASEDGSARVWEVATGKERATLLRRSAKDRLGAGSPRQAAVKEPVSVRRISFSPDGWLIAAALSDGTARIWSTTTMRAVAILQHSEAVRSVAFSPDSLRLVTASWDRTARLWDTQSGRQIGTAMVHQGWVQDAVFSPDGSKIVTASANPDTTTRLWDGKTGAPLGSYGDGPADTVKFDAAGTKILRVTKKNVEIVPIDAFLQQADGKAPLVATRFAAIGDNGEVRLGAVSGGNIVEEGTLSGAPDMRAQGEGYGLSIDGKPIVDGGTVDGRTAAGTVFKDCTSCPEMIVLPPGQFQRSVGSSKGLLRQTVRLSRAFAVGRFEVTNVEMRTAQRAERGARLPAAPISWDQATAYVKRLSEITGHSYRLLTEDEWEYAAGGVVFREPVTAAPASHDLANIGDAKCCTGNAEGADRWVGAAPVGQFRPNGFGLFDMIGNVAEWVQDCWTIDLGEGPNDGSAYEPRGCTRRVLRGGGFLDPASQAGIDARQFSPADLRNDDMGLRVARELK
jgi:formylglycine-generating enzyme required for sulfatase activity